MESAQEGKHMMFLATCDLFPATFFCTRRLDGDTGSRWSQILKDFFPTSSFLKSAVEIGSVILSCTNMMKQQRDHI